jgi:hypothetical protein
LMLLGGIICWWPSGTALALARPDVLRKPIAGVSRSSIQDEGVVV